MTYFRYELNALPLGVMAPRQDTLKCPIRLLHASLVYEFKKVKKITNKKRRFPTMQEYA